MQSSCMHHHIHNRQCDENKLISTRRDEPLFLGDNLRDILVDVEF